MSPLKERRLHLKESIQQKLALPDNPDKDLHEQMLAFIVDTEETERWNQTRSGAETASTEEFDQRLKETLERTSQALSRADKAMERIRLNLASLRQHSPPSLLQ